MRYTKRNKGYAEQTLAHLRNLGELEELRRRGRASSRDLEFAELTRRLGFEYNGMILHEYYFSNLRGGAGSKPSLTSKIGQALVECFGSVDERAHGDSAGRRGVTDAPPR